MQRWRVPLADIVMAEEEIAAVAETYRSGWLSMGPATSALEAELAAFTGARHALAVANGTAALHLMCAAVGLGPGDEVIVPSMTFVATVNAIAYTGAAPVFADIAGPHRPWLSASAVEAAITPRTKAIMTMAYGGHPGEIEVLARLSAARGLVLLEDDAHAIGARLGPRHLGTFGVAGAFSFFSNKNLAIGEGGAIVTDDDELAARMRLLRSHGMTSMSWDRHRGHASEYDVTALGFNYRIDEPRATLARCRLRRLDEDNARRGELVTRYREQLDDIEALEIALPDRAEAEPAHHLFTVVLSQHIDRMLFRRELAAVGVQTSVHYPPAHRFSIYVDAAADARLPQTERYGDCCVTLPLFAHMTSDQQDLVVSSVRRAVATTGDRSTRSQPRGSNRAGPQVGV